MRTSQIPGRLLAELLCILVLVQGGLTLARYLPAAELSGLLTGAMGAALLVLVCAPAMYWRCMAAVRLAALPGVRGTAADSAPGSAVLQRSVAIAMTAAAQLVGLVLTVLALVWVADNLEEEAQLRFERHVERVETEIARRFQLPVYGMRGARGVYAANRHITRAQFRAYVESRDLSAEFPGVRGFGFIERVKREDLDRFIERERADDAADFEVARPGPSSELYVVKYIEPYGPNHAARGLDLGAESVRRTAIERAVDSGEPTLTGKLSLRSSSERGPGFLYLVPVYRPGTDPSSAGQRRAVLVGLVFAPIYAANLLAGVANVADGALDFELLFGDGSDPGQSVFATAKASGTGAPGPAQESRRVVSRSLTIGGSQLTLRARATPAFEAQYEHGTLAYVGVGGALLSLLLALAVWSLASGRLRATTLAQRMTADMKRTSAELARERQRLENILLGTRVGTWEHDLGSGKTQIDDRWADMLGYTREEIEPVTEKTWLAHAHPDDLQRSQTALQRHFDAHTDHYECEIRLRHKLGHWIWVLSRGILFQRDVHGNPELMAGTHMEITRRKHAEDELRRNNEALQAILENLPCGLSVFDSRLRLQAHNREFRALLGLPDSLFDANTSFESITRHNAEQGEYGPVDVESTVAAIVERARHPVEIQFERVRPDGRTLDVRGAPMPGGGVVMTYTDLSERKRAEAIVRDSEHLMRLVTDNILARIAYWDSGLRLKFANKAFFERFGGSLAESSGFDASAIVGAERVASSRSATSAALRGEPQSFELEELTASGEVAHSLTHMIPDWREGTVHGFVALTLDIGFVKRAERELRDANQALAFERDRAEQASAAKGQFLANMSHEIRTPMNAILGMLKLLLQTPLTPRQFDYSRKTERAARALLRLLNDILDFSKVEAGKMTLDPRAFSLDELLRDLSVILSSNLGDKPVEVLFEVDPGLPARLVGDDMRLQQVLVNLAGNAIKFTEAGEVVVQLSRVGHVEGGCRLRFAVRDTGIGISAEQQQRVFGSFSQAEAATTRRYGGSGLGLSICQRLVGLMGGRIEVDSIPGSGSRFHFELTLPLVAEEAASQPSAPNPALRALIVDDNPTARAALACMAESLGWIADTAAGGDAAIELLREQLAGGTPYQAVLVDWQMPGLDGWQTCARMREVAVGQALPLLLMVTANGREKLARRTPEEQGMLDGFLVKPVTASMLVEAVMEARHGTAAPLAPAQSMRLAGMRILLVEDNVNNQQVARELLCAEGADVAIADDGAQGVAAVERADPPYDVVLMDVQMPVMDGYAATAAIRRRLGPADLPIIAMTANAMSGDRDASLATGMNDHVGKPFDLDQLVQTLLRHVARDGTGRRVERLAVSAALPQLLLNDARQRGIALEAAVSRFGGRVDVWTRSARSFADQLGGFADEWSSMLAAADCVAAGRLMHTLKGLAGMLGATRLSELAGAAEVTLENPPDAAERGRLREELLEGIDATRADFAALLQLQRASLPSAVNSSQVPGDQTLLEGLYALAALLSDADMAATDCFAELQVAHQATWSVQLRPLGEAVSALDFERALRECNQLARVLAAA